MSILFTRLLEDKPSGENVRKQLAKLRKHVLRDEGEIQGTRKRETFEEVKRV